MSNELSPTAIMILTPAVASLLLAVIFAWFRIGDANADSRRRPPWSATITLIALAIWIAFASLRGQSVLGFSMGLNGLLFVLLVVGLAVHHTSPQKRGRVFADDPAAFPACAALVFGAFATLRLLLDGPHPEPIAVLIACVFAQAQFQLFIYRKYRPLTVAPKT